MLTLSYGFCLVCYLTMPFVLGGWLRRRVGASWWLFAVGASIFTLSQVVHIPLLWLLGAIDMPAPPPWLARPVTGLTIGLAAGFCEEWARWAAFRFVLTRHRSYGDALLVGVGHGGIEAVILGAMLGSSLIAAVAFSRAGLDQIGIPAEQLAAAEAGLDRLLGADPLLPLLGVVERGVVIPFHIAMTTLVAYGVRRGRHWPVWLAVLAHTALDAPIVYLVPNRVTSLLVVWLLGVVVGSALILVWMSRAAEEKAS